jgi:hypothetical protein
MQSFPYEEITKARVEQAYCGTTSLGDLYIVEIGGVEVYRNKLQNIQTTSGAMWEAVNTYSRYLSK